MSVHVLPERAGACSAAFGTMRRALVAVVCRQRLSTPAPTRKACPGMWLSSPAALDAAAANPLDGEQEYDWQFETSRGEVKGRTTIITKCCTICTNQLV